jgi:sugar phosphate permease
MDTLFIVVRRASTAARTNCRRDQMAQPKRISKNRDPRFYYGWVIVAVVALGGFTQSAETFNVLSVFLKPITSEFGWDRTTFAGAMSIGSLLGGVIALAIGPLIDRFGSRTALGIAFAILGAVFVLMYWVTSLWEFYALQIIGRMVTNGVIGIAMSIVIPQWFIAKRGRAVAITSVGSQAGAALTPIYVQFLVTIGGWRVAALVAGLAIWLISLLPSVFLLRRRPEDMGLLPDGVKPGLSDLRSSTSRAREPTVSFSFSEAKKTKALYLLTASICTTWAIRTGTTLHMIPFFTDHGFSDASAVSILVLYSASGAAGAILWGLAADKYGARLSLVTDCVLIGFGVLFLMLFASNSMPLALTWAVVWGLTLSGQITLQRVIFADYFGRTRLGSIQGFVTVFQTIAQAAGPLIASIAYDSTQSYTSSFLVFAFASFGGAIFAYLAKPPVRGSEEGFTQPR